MADLMASISFGVIVALIWFVFGMGRCVLPTRISPLASPSASSGSSESAKSGRPVLVADALSWRF
jgi:hypothetical protein